MIRRPVAAGTFYPGDHDALARTVDDLLAEAAPADARAKPVALIVPHAGYVYSGKVAATAYVLLRNVGSIRRVVLAGPAHFVPLRGSAVPVSEMWETPLGTIAVDAELRAVALRAGALAHDEPHRNEHALEVQLPFLIRALRSELAFLPVAIGNQSPDDVAELLEDLRAHADLLVVSTDLSHHLDDATARRADRRTADALLAKSADGVADEAACGVFALRGLAQLARRHDLHVRVLDLATSADSTGDPDRVVGYGSFALT